MNDDFIDMFIESGNLEVGRYNERFVVYWNDGGDTYVCHWPDDKDIGHELGFQCSGFDAWEHVRNAHPIERARHAARLFDEVIIAGCDPQRAAREFMKIPEYKDFMNSFSKAFQKLD